MGSYAAAGVAGGAGLLSGLVSGRVGQAQDKANEAENERLNSLTWRAMANRISTVNVQRGLLRQQTGTDLYNIGKEANRAGSASINNAAASGTIGASVSDAVNDINRQQQEAKANTRLNEQTQEINLDSQVEDIINNAVSAQRYSVKPKSSAEILGSAVAGGAMQGAMTLALTSFDYLPTSGSGSSVGSDYSAVAATTPAANAATASNYNFNPDYSQLGGGSVGRYTGNYNFNF